MMAWIENQPEMMVRSLSQKKPNFFRISKTEVDQETKDLIMVDLSIGKTLANTVSWETALEGIRIAASLQIFKEDPCLAK